MSSVAELEQICKKSPRVAEQFLIDRIHRNKSLLEHQPTEMLSLNAPYIFKYPLLIKNNGNIKELERIQEKNQRLQKLIDYDTELLKNLNFTV
jgi:hypothetical protein